jgi:hypothetical protein
VYGKDLIELSTVPMLCGKTAEAGRTASLDFDLHDKFVQWRQLLIEMHMQAKIVLEHEAKQALESESQTSPLDAFATVFGFRLVPSEFCGGAERTFSLTSYPVTGPLPRRRLRSKPYARARASRLCTRASRAGSNGRICRTGACEWWDENEERRKMYIGSR